MGHLLTVQNLLSLLGGPPTFEREDYPWSSPYYPFPFCLEKLVARFARLLRLRGDGARHAGVGAE